MQTAIFFDIDGTLRDVRTGEVPRSAVEAVRRLRGAGYFLGIASGRSMREIEDNIRDIVDWDAYVCMNGQEIHTKRDGNICNTFLPDGVVSGCLEVAERAGLPVQLVSDGAAPYLTGEPDETIREAYGVFGITVPEVRRYDGGPVKALMVFGKDENDFDEYRRIGGIGVYPGAAKDTTGAVYADIVPDGISKHSGIEMVLERCGIGEYIAFGDSCNDVEMMSHAKISVAMGDAHHTAEAVATHRTDTVADGGVANACEMLGLYSKRT